MLRSIGSVALGYLSMAIVVMSMFAVLMSTGVFGEDVKKPELPAMGWLLLILAGGFLAGMAGGWVTVRVATHSHGKHVFALAIVMLLMWVISSFTESGQAEPMWMRAGNLVVGLVGISLGANLGLRNL